MQEPSAGVEKGLEKRPKPEAGRCDSWIWQENLVVSRVEWLGE
jgi:hypothetical protein